MGNDSVTKYFTKDAMSVHGICHDEGMSGNCGWSCRGFEGGECEIPDEIVESRAPEIVYDYYSNEQLQVIYEDPELHFDEFSEACNITEEEIGYLFGMLVETSEKFRKKFKEKYPEFFIWAEQTLKINYFKKL